MIYLLLQNVGLAKLFESTHHGHVLPTDSVSLQVSTGECPLPDLVCQNSFIEGLFIRLRCGRK